MTTGDGARILALEDRPRWVARLLDQGRVIAPTAGVGGDVVFAPVSSPADVLWEFENPLDPPKQHVLPQTDPLVRIRRSGDGIQPEPIHDEERQILFNIRSCDVKGLRYIEAAYQRDLADSGMRRRMDRTVLVSLACTSPCSHGFCVCCDAGPFLAKGFDLQLTSLADRVLVEIGSDKGRALLDGADGLFRPATKADLAARDALESQARRHFGEETCHFGSAMRRISTGRVPPALWERIGDWCFECGGCTHVCPTCYCFSVKDRATDGGWTRCRLWDSCQYAAFTLEASGHNPRPVKADRVRRRFFHKVSAQYFQRDGEVGCVGCGRCVKVCLGTTDMPAVVGAIRKGEWHG
jgi:formate hydrogenlyase subunit 6/NADH:ubiquinone oxidoreductase subunit I